MHKEVAEEQPMSGKSRTVHLSLPSPLASPSVHTCGHVGPHYDQLAEEEQASALAVDVSAH